MKIKNPDVKELENRIKELESELNTIRDRLKQEVTSRDNTLFNPQRKTENETKISLNTLISNLPGFIYRCANDKNWTMEYMSEGCYEITGFTAEDFLNNSKISFNDIVHPDYQEPLWQKWQELLSQRKPFEEEYPIITAKSETRWVWERGRGIFADSGELLCLEGFITDITKRKQAEADLIQSEAKFRSTFDQSPVGVAIVGLDKRFKRCNISFCKFLGYEESELIGKLFTEVTHQEDIEIGSQEIKLMVEGKIDLSTFRKRYIRKDGKTVWGEVTLSTICSPENKPLFFLPIIQDITDQKKKDQDLLIAKEKAEESDRLKTAFLQNMSHEIRTPMNAITGFSNLLDNPDLTSEKRKSFVEIIKSSCKQLLGIVNDILTISSIDTNQVSVCIKKVSVNSIIVELFAMFKPHASRQNISLFSKQQLTDKHSEIFTDRIKLIQILSNLISNSLKFTHKGHIEFGYQVKGKYLEFYVKDSGIGIKAELQEKIFERFRQADMSINKLYGGTGLGLSISKAFTELLGGKIWVESEPDKGSAFYFTIPYLTTEDQEPVTVRETRNISEPVILVVEDEEYNFLFIEEILNNNNHKSMHAKNGIEAIELCRTHPNISLVLMDIKMPIMDGETATKLIKEIRPGLPVIAQTSYALKHEIEKYAEAGFDEYITKPINIEEFDAVIDKYFSSLGIKHQPINLT